MMDKSWEKSFETVMQTVEDTDYDDFKWVYTCGLIDFQKRLLEEIEKEVERYGTDQADMNLHDFKEMVLNLKA
jgi:hypothetical protein